MTADFPTTDRCPKCGAAVRFGDPWCTLCFADLRPPAPAPRPEPPLVADPPAYSPAPVGRGPDPLTAPLDAVSSPVTGPSWPCAACGTVNPMANDTCSTCGRHFLAGLREGQAPLLELPVVGDITKLSRGQRFAVAFGAVFVVLVLTVLLGLIFR
ncbi:MAG: hypothetical protein QOI82_2584 [Actinomycetota bacterium]|jgi:hypothetical protein|nr:hypothetical protein [Actinomycetota bacterium]